MTVTGAVISPDGSYVLITTSGAPTGNGGRIRKIDLSNNTITTLATCTNPTGIAIHPTLNYAYIITYPGQLLRLDLVNNTIDVLINSIAGNGYPLSMSPDGTFLLFVRANPWTLMRVDIDSDGNMTGNLQTINVSGEFQTEHMVFLMADSDTVILGTTNPKVFSITNPGTLLSNINGITGTIFPARTKYGICLCFK